MSAPQLISLPFRDWSVAWGVVLCSGLAAALYLGAATRSRRWPGHRTLSFLLGLLAIQVALESGIDGYDDRMLSAHMLQHLLLIEVAPALILCGRPVHLALRTLSGRERQTLGHALIASRRALTPAACLLAYSAIVLVVHIPAVFDLAVRNQRVHDAEHLSFLLAGFLVWWPLLGDPEPHRRLGAIGQLIYITIAMLPMTLIGAYLDRDRSLFYSAYAVPTRMLGLSPIADQQRAGAIMWVGGTTLMAAVGLATVLGGMLEAERRQRLRELHEVAR